MLGTSLINLLTLYSYPFLLLLWLSWWWHLRCYMLCWVFEGLEKWDNTDTEVMLVCIEGTSVCHFSIFIARHTWTHAMEEIFSTLCCLSKKFGLFNCDPKIGHFWSFCLIKPFVKHPKNAVLGIFENDLISRLLGDFSSPILQKTNLEYS